MPTRSLRSSSSSARHSRRHFIRNAGLAMAGAAAFSRLNALAAGTNASAVSAPAEKGLVGSNIYVWTQYAQRDKKPLDVEGVISALRDCGYDYLETFVNLDHPEENAKFAAQLRAKGLQPVSLYTPARLHEKEKLGETLSKIVAAANVCRQAGFKVICCNADPIGREKTGEELQTQAEGLAQLGDALNSLEMKLAVHQHLPEMANDGREFHYDFDHTKPELVGWCFDVNWVWKGGVVPLDGLKQYGNRVVTWHLRQSRDGVWLEDLESGDIDYPEIAKYADAHHLPKRYTVELAIEPGTKITRSAVENHRLSREYVKKVFGV
jgi:inosose dehydratase